MGNKQFKAESKRLLDLMINSIYTNKEIFLRELISNASDAIDKLYFRSLTDQKIKMDRSDFKIDVIVDKEKRQIIIEDNGIGMTEEELDKNLGTIARSGSMAFKEQNENVDDIDIIGQFGVGFYSSFMVSKEVVVESKSIDSDKAYKWSSKGVDGYSIEETEKNTTGTRVTLYIKDNTEEETYDQYLDKFAVRSLIKKYSDYIRYPIKMDDETINSMIPIWKKDKKDIKEEEYNEFYKEKFFDFENPLKTIHTAVEGQYKYNSLLFIPSHMAQDYYTKNFKKGLKLFASGVLIMDKCEELLPDYLGFVKGLVDSDDLSLNISREMLQHDRQLKVIAKNIESKIRSELENMLKNDREKYEEFFKVFGLRLKYGTYENFGMNKDKLKDLLLFYSSTEKKLVTLKEYVSRMKEEQKAIYYACGETIDKIDMLPQLDYAKSKEYEVLYLTDDVDEFVFQMINNYDEKEFKNVSSEDTSMESDEEKESLKKENEDNKPMFEFMMDAIKGEVQEIRFTHRLKNHPICLTSEGAVSVEMAKTLNSMPNSEEIKANTILEINSDHEISSKLKELYKDNKEELKNYTKILYAGARLIEGLNVENPTEISNLICDIISKKDVE